MRVGLRRIIMGVLGLGVVAVLVYAFLPEPIEVDAAEVMSGPMQITVDEEGQTRIRERYVISAPLAGRLRRLALDPGDAVEARSTVVAVIEPTDPHLLDARALAEAEARVRAAEAAVHQAGARRAQARTDLDWAEEEYGNVTAAFERSAATAREVEEKRTRYRSAADGLRAAQFAEEIGSFELELARSALLHTQPGAVAGSDGTHLAIHAPINGRVLRVFQESVAVIQAGAPLLEIGDPADLELVIDVLSSDAVSIVPGAAVSVEQWGGPRALQARVRLVEPSAFTKVSALGVEEQRVNVVGDFISPFDERPTLGDGFRVEGRIVLWQSEGNVVQVPASALFRAGEGWAVYAIEGSRAVQRPISVGHRTGLSAEVLEGLRPGELVLVHPSDRVHDGAPVRRRR